MFYVIRNGQYISTEKKLFGDIEVTKRPHEKAEFINGEWVLNADKFIAEVDKTEAQEFLNNTDWKVIRHKEQEDLGIKTSLTSQEYLELIKLRQVKREVLNDLIK